MTSNLRTTATFLLYRSKTILGFLSSVISVSAFLTRGLSHFTRTIHLYCFLVMPSLAAFLGGPKAPCRSLAASSLNYGYEGERPVQFTRESLQDIYVWVTNKKITTSHMTCYDVAMSYFIRIFSISRKHKSILFYHVRSFPKLALPIIEKLRIIQKFMILF